MPEINQGINAVRVNSWSTPKGLKTQVFYTQVNSWQVSSLSSWRRHTPRSGCALGDLLNIRRQRLCFVKKKWAS